MTPLTPFILVPGAFLAGVLMFLAPCTLPIVPGYLAFIAGSKKERVVRNALAFVIGFSVIFILLGVFAGAAGSLLGPWREYLGRAVGVVIIIFGLTMLGLLRLPGLRGDWHVGLPGFLTVGRPESSLLIGALFAFGWSPCIGPILGTVLLLAAGQTTALQGALLLLVFSLGLAVPFLLTALLLKEAEVFFVRASGFLDILSVVGGIVLVLLGILMLLGDMALLVSWGYGAFNFLGYDRLLNYL